MNADQNDQKNCCKKCECPCERPVRGFWEFLDNNAMIVFIPVILLLATLSKIASGAFCHG